MTIDSLNGLGNSSAYLLPDALRPNAIQSPLTVADALSIATAMYAQFEAWDRRLEAAVGTPAPEPFLVAKEAAQQDFLLAVRSAEDALAVLPVRSALDQGLIRQLQVAADALGRLGQSFATLERTYGTDKTSGNVIAVMFGLAGVAGLFWWLRNKKRTSRSRKALGCASCGSKRR